MTLQLFGFRVRHLQTLMLFFCLCVNYMMRVNLSLGIVLMTDKNSTSDAKIFNWTVAQQSASQSVFFAGYFFMNLAAAILVTRFSNKVLLLGSVTVSTVLTLGTPLLVTAGDYYMLVAIRFILGLMQGCMMAGVMGMMSRWIPPNERSRCGAIIFGGMHMGNLISFSASGWIGSQFGGWPSIFYFTGVFGALWSILWIALGADSPKTCTYIPIEEKKFIEMELLETATLPKNIPVPWKEVVLSKACWAILFATLGHSWGYWTLVTEIPSFFNTVLHFSDTVNGLLTSLPFACMWIVSFPISYVSDFLTRKEILSVALCRKIFNSIGHFSAAICLIILGSTTDESVAVSMYIIGVTLLSFAYIGHNINHLDIVPNFSGFLMGITNGFANISSFSGPLFAGLIVKDAGNPDEWRTVFFVSAAIFIIGNVAFCIMGSGEVQSFNKLPEGNSGKELTKKMSVCSTTLSV